MSAPQPDDVLYAWRHPRAEGGEGRCIGLTDLSVDPRRAKRLAHRIRDHARCHELPRIVVTSGLARSAAVGHWLARWGWVHRVDATLGEMDFGRWSGRPWADVPRAEFDAWCADFAHYPVGGGESVAALLRRVAAFEPGQARIVVTHGGWLSAALWLMRAADAPPDSVRWPMAPPHGARVDVSLRALRR